MATKTNRSNVLLSVEVCGDGDEANGGFRGDREASEGSLRNYKFRDGGGSEEARGGGNLLNS